MPPMRVRRRESAAFTVVVTVLVALCAVPMAAIIGYSGGGATTVIAVLLAAVPVGPLVAAYLWLDRYEPEPRSLLAMGLLWGGFVATAAALLIGGIGGLVVGITDEQSLSIVAPVTEEASKGFFLLLLLWWRRAELDGVLDGIVYAGMVGIGFAFVENILYLGAAYNGTDATGPGGVQAVTATFVVRCLFSPFAHPLFTAFTGIGVGLAVTSRSSLVRVAAPVAGYICAVLAHAIWNTSTLGGFNSFVMVYLVVMVPGFLAVAAFAVYVSRSERRLLTAALQDAARRELFPAGDIPYMVDLRARRESRRFAQKYGGKAGARAMASYQQAAIELGFLHHRFLRGTAPRDFSDRGQDFVNQLQALRPQISFPGQAVTTR